MRPKVEADSSVVESNNWQVGDLGAIWFSSPVAKEMSNAVESIFYFATTFGFLRNYVLREISRKNNQNDCFRGR